MPERPIVQRIDQLEQRVDFLEALPARVAAIEVQLLQLRGEMQDGFSANRAEMHAMGEALRTDLRGEMHAMGGTLRADLRDEMHDMGGTLRADLLAKIQALDDDLRAEMHALHHLTIERIDAGDAETRRYMRVMIEEVLARIETIGERRRTRKTR